jgi:hypothetical protein
MIMIMSMGWDYVSELRPPTGLLFIPRWYMSTAFILDKNVPELLNIIGQGGVKGGGGWPNIILFQIRLF